MRDIAIKQQETKNYNEVVTLEQKYLINNDYSKIMIETYGVETLTLTEWQK